MALTPLAIENEPILRRLAPGGAPIESKAALAREFERDRANFQKTLGRLDAEGLVDISGAPALTTRGLAALSAIDRANASDTPAPLSPAPAGGLPRAPHDAFRPNPDQPRRTFDPDALADLARAIAAAGDILQPLVVRPADASGARMILDGERRWRAVQLLADDPQLLEDHSFPAALLSGAGGGGLPYIERPAAEGDDPADPLFLALIANGARADLDPLEDGQAMLALMTARNWSARELAARLGRVGKRDGQPGAGATGIKTVQERVKVAREATPAALTAYRAGGTWKELLASVQDKAPAPAPLPVTDGRPETFAAARDVAIRAGCASLMGRRLLALIELGHKATMDPHPDVERATVILPPGERRQWDPQGAIDALLQHTGAMFMSDACRISDVALQWLIDEGHLDLNNPEGTLHNARAEHGNLNANKIRMPREGGRWTTPWLNATPPLAQEPDPSDPRVYNGFLYPNATIAAERRRLDERKGGAASPRTPVSDRDREALAGIEPITLTPTPADGDTADDAPPLNGATDGEATQSASPSPAPNLDPVVLMRAALTALWTAGGDYLAATEAVLAAPLDDEQAAAEDDRHAAASLALQNALFDATVFVPLDVKTRRAALASTTPADEAA